MPLDGRTTYHFRVGEYDAACDLVLKHHYSRRVPSNVQMIGTMHEPGSLSGDRGECAAAMFLSIPGTRWRVPVWELSRLVAKPGYSGGLTPLISRTMREAKPRIGLVVSFADRTHGHTGYVYQASSWNYAGRRDRRCDGAIIDGAFWPGRSLNSKFGTQSPAKLRTIIGRDVAPHFDEGKHLYWRALTREGERQALAIGLGRLPYPKGDVNERRCPLTDEGGNNTSDN